MPSLNAGVFPTQAPSGHSKRTTERRYYFGHPYREPDGGNLVTNEQTMIVLVKKGIPMDSDKTPGPLCSALIAAVLCKVGMPDVQGCSRTQLLPCDTTAQE